jgi:hypothetical protein
MVTFTYIIPPMAVIVIVGPAMEDMSTGLIRDVTVPPSRVMTLCAKPEIWLIE